MMIPTSRRSAESCAPPGLLALGCYPQKFYPRPGILIAVFPGRAGTMCSGVTNDYRPGSVVSIPVMIDDAVDLVDALDWREEDIRRSVLREAIAKLTHVIFARCARGKGAYQRFHRDNRSPIQACTHRRICALIRCQAPAPRNILFWSPRRYRGGGHVEPEGRRRLPADRRRVARGRIEPVTTRNDTTNVHDDYH